MPDHLARKTLLNTLLAMILAGTTSAHHFRGGEIRYAHVEGHTYQAEFVLYTRLGVPIDIHEIVVDWGDGTTDTIPLASFHEELNDSTCNGRMTGFYQAEHTWPGPGSYQITTRVFNRSSGILNIPESVNIPACISALLVIDPVLGPNNSIRFNHSQAYFTWNWNTLVHDPGMSEADGDSIAFEVVVPLGQDCIPIVGWTPPGGASNTWLDPASGVFQWELPQLLGEWNLTIRGSEWRNGQLIGQVTRDMTVCITAYEVGVQQWADGPAPHVYPTVTDGLTWVVNPAASALRTEILTLAGSVVYTSTTLPGTHPIDLSGLGAGTYLVRLTDANQASAVFRVVRQ